MCLTAPPEHSLSRCSETAGRVKKGLGLAVLTDSPTKNRKRRCPALHSAVASLIAGLAGFLPTAPSGFALGALVFFVLRLADMRDRAGHRRFTPRKIMPLVLSAFGFQSQKQYHPWAVTQAAEPPGLSGQASELYYEKIR